MKKLLAFAALVPVLALGQVQSHLDVNDHASASVVSQRPIAFEAKAPEVCFDVTATGADGTVKWTDRFCNTVTNGGRNDVLDKYFGNAAAGTFYLGLTGATPTCAAADTSASHAGWTEFVNYSAATRPAPTWSAASSQSKTVSAAVSYSINGAGGTVGGAFLITDSTKSGSTGTLYDCAAFSGGNKTVSSGDTLNVTPTVTD